MQPGINAARSAETDFVILVLGGADPKFFIGQELANLMD